MNNEKTTEEKLSNIWDGLLFHLKDLSEFMVNYSDDPFFDTDFGREVRASSARILMDHTHIMLRFMLKKKKGGKPDLEEMLKDFEF